MRYTAFCAQVSNPFQPRKLRDRQKRLMERVGEIGVVLMKVTVLMPAGWMGQA